MNYSTDPTILELSRDLQNNQALEKLQIKFFHEFQYKLNVGVEIEFYLHPANDQILKTFNLREEKGRSQFEFEVLPSTNLTLLAKKIKQAIKGIKDTAKDNNGKADFSSKPYEDDYGNAMHFHLEILDPYKNNVFAKDKKLIYQVANSICNYMQETFLVYANREPDFKRFNQKYLAPTHISFGNNNRTVALRTPNSSPLRLEHRLASPSNCAYLALYTILRSIYLGLKAPEKIKNFDKIYGNAYDSQYELTALPSNINVAKRYFNREFFVNE